MNNHVNISFQYQYSNQLVQQDLRIPLRITVNQLLKELEGILPGYVRKHKNQIKVINKGILLDENKRLSDYTISHGDILEILED